MYTIIVYSITYLMRQILSVSLPTTEIKELKTRKNRGFVSVSSYVQKLIQDDENLISVKELLKIAKKAQKEYKAGNQSSPFNADY